MDSHITCTICDHSFNCDKELLVLPCSHSFCRDCLQQVEAAGDKRCPVCRKDWTSVRVADLPSGYEVTPVVSQEEEDGIEAADDVPQPDTCEEHVLAVDLWCESCEVSACKKCWRRDHRNCEVILIEEKCDALKEVYSTSLIRLKEGVQSKVQLYESNSKKDLKTVKRLQKKLVTLENDLREYQKGLELWQSEVNKVVTNDTSSVNSIRAIRDNIAALEKLEAKLPVRPASLLLPVAAACQKSPEDVDAFISALQSSVEPRLADDPTSNESIKEAIAALTDGGDWVVSDATSAAAVHCVLQTTCMRPKTVEIFWGYVQEELISDLQALSNCVNLWTLDCFHHFDKPSSETRNSTSTKLDTLIQCNTWAVPTQFWGHLDAVAVQKLPATITSVGLVLRDQEDMAAVNALARAAIMTQDYYYNDKYRLKWPGWTDLNLSVAKTFRPDDWMLAWQWKVVVNNQWTDKKTYSLSILPALGVRLRLHLPQLVPDDRRWMDDIFRVMGLKGGGFSDPVTLLLPGARTDPDALLGMLRDSGQAWEVHLPASLPQLVTREEVAERYKGYGHSVTWDLE